MKASSTSFRFSSLLFFFIVAAFINVVYSQSKCEYELFVQTGAVFEAGTNSSIGVILSSFAGLQFFEIPDLKKWGVMSPGHDYFKYGNHDSFRVRGPCMHRPVCMITVTSDGSGQEPGWYLESVTVLIAGSVRSHTNIKFEFHQWLANDELMASRDLCAWTHGVPTRGSTFNVVRTWE